jgi:hypothetical protein
MTTVCIGKNNGNSSPLIPVKTQRNQYKMSSSKKMHCKWTLRQVFIRFYTVDWTFLASLSLVPLLHFSLLSGSILPPRPRCVNKYTVYMCKGGGVELCWRPYSAGFYHSVSNQI